jgi:hypothetical protein
MIKIGFDRKKARCSDVSEDDECLYRNVLKICQYLDHFCKRRLLHFISKSSILMNLMHPVAGYPAGKFVMG